MFIHDYKVLAADDLKQTNALSSPSPILRHLQACASVVVDTGSPDIIKSATSTTGIHYRDLLSITMFLFQLLLGLWEIDYRCYAAEALIPVLTMTQTYSLRQFLLTCLPVRMMTLSITLSAPSLKCTMLRIPFSAMLLTVSCSLPQSWYKPPRRFKAYFLLCVICSVLTVMLKVWGRLWISWRNLQDTAHGLVMKSLTKRTRCCCITMVMVNE